MFRTSHSARGLIVAALLGFGCNETKNNSTATIGATGGSISVTDGTKVDFPNGALAADTVITISPASSPPSSAVGPAYDFGPEGATFAVPVTITLPFDPSRVPQGRTNQDIVILTAPSGSTDFVSVGGTLIDATHIRSTTTHFSVCVAGVLTRDREVTDAGIYDSGSSEIRCGPVFYGACATCMKMNCANATTECFGPDWMTEVFAGPCTDLVECLCACPDEQNCNCQAQEQNASCSGCYGSSFGPCQDENCGIECGGDVGGETRIFNVTFSPAVDVSICAGTNLYWSSQNISVDEVGAFSDVWAPNEPNTARIEGMLNETTMTATLTCVGASTSGTLNATKNGSTYSGTFSFNGSSGSIVVEATQ